MGGLFEGPVLVSADILREEMRSYLPRFMDELHSWTTFEYAWVQRFAVTTYCRALYTLHTGRVASKLASLRWAMDTLDKRWSPLLTQVIRDRAPFDPDVPPRPGTVEETLPSRSTPYRSRRPKVTRTSQPTEPADTRHCQSRRLARRHGGAEPNGMKDNC